MGGVSRGGRSRWVLAFTLLLCAVGSAAVLADPAAPQEPPAEAPPPAPEEGAIQLPGAAEIGPELARVEAEEAEREAWLASPAAVEEREASWLAYGDSTPAESEALLHSYFAEQLAMLNSDPARFLSDAQLVRELDESAAAVKEEGDRMLLDSSVPVRTEDEEGDLAKVDLSLEATAEGYETANAHSEVSLPSVADEEIEVGEEGFAIAQAGAGESTARRYGEMNAFYPEVLPDTDLLVSPTAAGVELFDLLRSKASPELLRFDLDFPEGAVLRSDGYGGADVLRDEELLTHISPPVAIDAQGTAVPVELGIEQSAVALRVEHRAGNFAYPILVDPIVEDWVNASWYHGWGHAGLGAWTPKSNNSHIATSTCCYGGVSVGLMVSTEANWFYGPEQFGQWSYSMPNLQSYIQEAWISPFWRHDAGCKSAQPHDYNGLWNEELGKYNPVHLNYALQGTSSMKGLGHAFVIGMGTGPPGVWIQCARHVYAGGVALWLNDYWGPYIKSVEGIPPSKWLSDKTPLTVTVNAADDGLGLRRVSVHPEASASIHDNVDGCTGLYANRCPTTRASQFTFTGDSLREGIRTLNATAEDPLGKVTPTISIGPTMIDRTSPEIVLEGQLAEETKEDQGEEQGNKEVEQLRLPVYNLAIKAKDGIPASTEPKDWRSGVKDIKVSLDGVEQKVPWSAQPCPGPKFSCPMEVTYTLGLSGIETAGMHTLEITAVDFAENEHVRHIEFEYFPATGIKDSYLMHYFPLPDGLGNEDEEEHPARPELAVNVMNGNLVYRERDFEVEGAAVDLELERFYNSQLPDSQSTEWGDGWTLAETPALDPEEGPAPSEAEVLDSSGSLSPQVELPTEAGKEEFDPGLQATIAKEPDGGYELTDETGESATSVAFNEAGRAEALRTEGYAKVDYVYEAGRLAEIEVQDPATFAADPEELEIESGLIEKPTYDSSFGKYGSLDGQLRSPADVALDSAGNLWVADRANNRIQKFDPDGKFLFKFGAPGTGSGQFSSPAGVAIDPKGNLWVIDRGNHRVQKFDPSGKFLLKAGAFGSGKEQFLSPESITTDAKGNVYVCDTANGRIQKLSEAGAFLGEIGVGKFAECTGIDVGPYGRIWAADWVGHRVNVFDESGTLLWQFGKQGSGPGEFKNPDAIEIDAQGNVYVGDASNHRVQQFDSESKFIAQFGSYGAGEGQFNLTYPLGIETDSKGRLWVADPNNNRIQRWLAPITAPAYESSFGTYGSGEGQLKAPADVALGLGGSLWVADKANSRIQMFGAEGKFLFQLGSYGSGDGQFHSPAGVAVDRDGNLLVLDRGAHRVQKFDPSGKFILKFGSFGTAPGQFLYPESIAADFEGNIWVCDNINGRIQRFDEEGKLLEVLGSKGSGPGQFGRCTGIDVGPDGRIWAGDWTNNRVNVFGADGKFLFAFGSSGAGPGQFNHPQAIEIDRKGDVYVGDLANHRVQLFDSEGKYVRQLGSSGAGPGQFNFTFPLGIETDAKGRLWVADPNNNRIQRWLTAHYAPVQSEPIELSDGDPAVQVASEGGLITSVEGKAAGEHSYEHEGEALVSHDGPDGETAYDYDGAGRLTKVTLANGTWAEIEYEAHGRVKAVEVAPEGANAKTTTFEYTDTDPRRTTVIPPDDPHLVYDIGADGSVLKWWNKELPPELKLAGTLYDHKEKPEPIWNGDHWLESQAKSKEGIASIEVIANGNVLVSEETCAQTEAPGVECDEEPVIDEWVTHTDLHAPGHLQVEVIATDRIGESTSERFWVDIPPPPPPPAPGSPIPPKFRDILEFREEFGLEVVFPVKNETERNERIFNLINAWYEGDAVARASAERWGVPLRPADIAELEYREWYTAHNAPLISQWGEGSSPATYAGYFQDERAGGLTRIGFKGPDSSAQIESLIQGAGLVAGDRVGEFTIAPSNSLSDLKFLEGAISNQNYGSITQAAINTETNRVAVGASDVNELTVQLANDFGGQAPFDVYYEPDQLSPRGSGRERNFGNIAAGDFLTSPYFGSLGCTAGYGAWEKNQNHSNGGAVRRLFVLDVAHCFIAAEKVERRDRDTHARAKVGIAVRDGYEYLGNGHQVNGWNTDSVAIKVESSELVPRDIWAIPSLAIQVHSAAQIPPRGTWVCFSGQASDEVICGRITVQAKVSWNMGGNVGSQKMWVVCHRGRSIVGDSGGPVWIKGTRKAVGLVSAGDKDETCFTPLLPIKGHPRAPGALAAPGMGDLNLMTR